MNSRVKLLNLKTESTENMSINTFGNSKSKTSLVDRMMFLTNTKYNENICLQAISAPPIYLPMKSQTAAFAHEIFQRRRGLYLAYSWIECEVDQLICSCFYWNLLSGKVRV